MSLNLYEILNSILNEADEKTHQDYEHLNYNVVGEDDVINALRDKRCVVIQYNDEQDDLYQGDRWIEPYILVNMPSGDLGLRAFAFNGASRRGVPHWKLFLLRRIKSWKPTTSRFIKPRDGFNENMQDKRYPEVYRVHFDDEDRNIQKNINQSIQKNTENNRDYFGRIIDKKKEAELKRKKKQQKQDPNNGPAQLPQDMKQTSGTTQTVSNQGPAPLPNDYQRTTKDWKKFLDLKYQKDKRDRVKADNLRKQVFGNEEEDMLDDFDSKPLFKNNNF